MRKISKKRAKLNPKYSKIKDNFLIGKNCVVTNQKADQVHHAKGKQGYADAWARLNDVPLLIDVRFFIPVCMQGHRIIEDNPAMAYEKGYSLSRLEKKEYPENYSQYEKIQKK